MNIISVGFYGSLNSNTVFWRELLKYVKLEGIKVCVISEPGPEAIMEKLESSGYTKEVHYDSAFSILSLMTAKGMDIWFDEVRESWHTQEDAWWAAKAEICRKIRSKIHFDNDNRFARAFEYIPTRFVHTDSKPGSELIVKWRDKLKMANTWNDEDYDYKYMMM